MARGAPKKKQGVITQLELLRLNRWNRWFAAVYIAEGFILFIFGTAYSVPIIINYLAVNPINTTVAGHAVLSPATRQLFNVSIPGIIAAIFALSALAHSLLATLCRKHYESGLPQGVNTIRWFEYAISTGLMMTIVGLVSGVYDLATLLAIFGFMAIAQLFWLVTELTSSNSRPNWLTYWSSTAVSLVPWLIIALYAFNATYYGMAHIPPYVYGIYCTMLVCVAGFVLNLYLYYRRRGMWANYVTVERGFMALGLVAKSLLAWQIFMGVLRP